MPRFASPEERFLSHVHKTDDCWLWTGAKGPKGYGQSNLRFGDCVEHRAHRIAWRLYKGPIPKGLLVCHHCDKPSCVNPDHLFLGTHFDNIHDCIRKGRRSCPGILTPEQIHEIREAGNYCHSTRLIGLKYGVSKGTISGVLCNKIYRNV